jgi:hypothetical protein|tara:strand:+ start:93 stop:242 length:150 start_codon:yes stop_codon:yes gene_type:complete
MSEVFVIIDQLEALRTYTIAHQEAENHEAASKARRNHNNVYRCNHGLAN